VKFVVKKVRDGCRLGELVISEKDVLGNVQTPMCMLYTRGGEWTVSVLLLLMTLQLLL